MEAPDRHGWIHSMCFDCWLARNAEKVPRRNGALQLTESFRGIERCCYCGRQGTAGIVVRARASTLEHCPDNRA
jgi:hypothetical protein